ncbi:helix-turn-helix transcriptional regulator [Kitasatospora cinereorecta]|uniref:Response regulator transcription factor n=1 Tax=Kitasatospora cinereorecta TaxID=285560 RepID=A0ABW0VFB5_9ACTN
MTLLAERPALAAAPAGPPVHLVVGPGGARIAALLHRLGAATGTDPADPDTVRIAVAARIEDAVRVGAAAGRPLLVVCDSVTPAGLRLAIAAGVAAVLRTADLTPEQLAAAVRAARHGDGRIAYATLSHLLAGAGREQAPPAAPQLTARQTEVLDLMAEGHGNAVIARTLRCSEHTVKNVIYELMTRLQARNRAHAVAHAVRCGLV